jgi:Skp family chaperone for outer membrane proteins
MKKIILAGAAAVTLIGAASAQQPSHAPSGDITRAAAVADAERRFAALDTDGNGLLEPSEKRQAFQQRRAERLSKISAENRALFEQRRTERAGETEARRGGRAGSAEARRARDVGPTTLAQFRAQAEQRFDRLDLDRNGVITAAEQAQLRAQRDSRDQ